MNGKSLLIVLSFFLPFFATSQPVTISGQVYSGRSRLADVQIDIPGYNSSDITDIDGLFYLKLASIKNGDVIFLRAKKKGYFPINRRITVSQLMIPIELQKIPSKPVTKTPVKPATKERKENIKIDNFLSRNNVTIKSPTDNPFGLNGDFSGILSIYKDSVVFLVKKGLVTFNTKFLDKRADVMLYSLTIGISTYTNGSYGQWNIIQRGNTLRMDTTITPSAHFRIDTYKFKVLRPKDIDLNSAWLTMTFNVSTGRGTGTMYVHSDKTIFH